MEQTSVMPVSLTLTKPEKVSPVSSVTSARPDKVPPVSFVALARLDGIPKPPENDNLRDVEQKYRSKLRRDTECISLHPDEDADERTTPAMLELASEKL